MNKIIESVSDFYTQKFLLAAYHAVAILIKLIHL